MKTSLPVLLGVVVVDLIGFGIVMPVLPFYAKAYGADATALGLLLTGYAAAQFVFAPLWGRLSDRVGRRPVMLATIAGTTLSLLMLGLASTLAGLFAARLLGGGFAANVSVASAYIADASSEEERTRWMGLLGAAFGVGFLLGPAIGGLLVPYGHAVPMLAAAGLAAANGLWALAVLREPLRRGARGPAPTPRAVLRDRRVRQLWIANLAFSLGVTQLETVFAFFMIDRFGLDAAPVAFLMAGMALIMVGVQGGAIRPLAARLSERRLVMGGALLLAAAFAAIPFLHALVPLMAVLALAAAGRAVLHPSLLSLTSLLAAPGERGAVMGTFQSAASLARVLGPVAAGWLYDRELAAPFWLAAALLVAVLGLGRHLPRRAVGPAGLAG